MGGGHRSATETERSARPEVRKQIENGISARKHHMIILLYVMDSLRPDFLSCYGYAKETSPNVDRLAHEGVVFTNAFAQSTWTRASAASILTSVYPSVHRVINLNHAFGGSVPTLPEALQRLGFKTVAITSMANISPYFGFGRGFDHFVELYKEESVKKKRKMTKTLEGIGSIPIPTSEDIHDFLVPFLRNGLNQDLFIFVWSGDTHDPYFHRDPDLARFASLSQEALPAKEIIYMHSPREVDRLKSLYEDMIYYNDHQIGRLIMELRKRDLFDQTLFIFTSDHGESFGEHGVNSHGGAPFDEVIRIPLIIKFPQTSFRGKLSGLVQHIDLSPTLLDLIGRTDGHSSLQGKSLLPLLRDKTPVHDLIFLETQLGPKTIRYFALRTEEYKYVELRKGDIGILEWLREKESLWPFRWTDKPRWLFRLREDPGETVNRAGQEKEREDFFGCQLKTILKGNSKLSKSFKERRKGETVADEEVAKQLKALGYFD